MLAEQLAEYADELSYEELDEETVETTKARLIDSVACAYAGRDEPPVDALLSYATRKSGERDATVLVDGDTTTVEHSAFGNGALIRYLDWNDTYLSKEPAHPSDNFGAVLAGADAYDASGEDLVLAAVLAYELQCRLCDASSLRKNGWDHVNYGLVSATLAVGKLAGLSQDEMVESLGLAINPHVAMRQARAGELSEWKGFAFANVSRNAVVAVELADEGVEGPAPIFEGKFGFFNQLTGKFELDLNSFGGRGGDFKINETYIKFYPVEYHAQAAVNIVMDLLDEVDPDEIESIRNETYEAAVSIISEEEEKWDPETRETADHSMPYCIARTFLDGEMTLDQFAPDKIKGDEVRELMDKMTIVENERYTEVYGDAFPHKMVVETSEGTYERELEYPKGHPGNPLTDEELEDKFRECAEDALGDEGAGNALEWMRNVEEKENASELFDYV
ncbi:MAG: MmgE/PrpD family protein [Halobacteriales archaeon]|nr:MmgE/PrpD family protein [Halobacteriales archaeon]